jgi:hypothetical protein
MEGKGEGQDPSITGTETRVWGVGSSLVIVIGDETLIEADLIEANQSVRTHPSRLVFRTRCSLCTPAAAPTCWPEGPAVDILPNTHT